MTNADLSIAILSDLHAHDLAPDDQGAPSFLSTLIPDSDVLMHPIASLKKLVTDRGLKADLLLCCGDLTDKANPKALDYVWSELQALKNLLGAKSFVTAPGNHDMDSRHKSSDYDARGLLQSLSPMFPGLKENLCDRFWSRNFVLVEDEDWRLLVLNSAAYHGSGKDQFKEMEHGRVSSRTVAAIKEAIQSSQKRKINILACHHHVERDTFLASSDYSEMDGADLLLRLLGSGDHGRWLIIHGHKHLPRLFTASSSTSMAPIVFSAGSLSAHLYKDLQGHARNQFYILTLPVSRFEAIGLDLAGSVTAWDWAKHSGWKPAGENSGLPHRTGFGYMPQLGVLAKELFERIRSRSEYLMWSEVLDQIPQLEFLLPKDLTALLRILETDHGVQAIKDNLGGITQLGSSS